MGHADPTRVEPTHGVPRPGSRPARSRPGEAPPGQSPEENEQRLRLLTEQLPAILWTTDSDLRVTSVTGAGMAALGMSPEQTVGRTLSELLETSDRTYLPFAAHLKALEGESAHYEMEWHGRCFRTHITPLREPGGAVIGCIGLCFDLTDRRRAEEALRQSEELNRRILDTVPGGVVTVGADGSILQANAEARRLLGLSWEEMARRFVPDWEVETVWEDGSPCPASAYPVTKCLETGLPQPGVTIGVRRPDGELTWAIFTAVPLRDPGADRPRGAVVTFLDITGRKQAEQALRKSEERFQLIARATKDAVWDWDLLTDEIWWSEGLEALFGYPRDQLSPDAGWWYDKVHPEERDRVTAGLRAAIRDGAQVWSAEYRFRRADGSYAHAQDRGYLIRDAAGRPVRMVGALVDVTERRRAEEVLRESEERFRALIENSSDGIAVLSADGELIYASPSTFRMLGYGPEELLGEEGFRHIHPDDLPGVRARLADLMERPGGSVSAEARVRHKDGSWHWLEGVGTNLLGESSVRGVVFNFRDVTERKQLEEQFLQAQKMDAVGRLAGGVAHDFNNLLTVINGYTDLLLASPRTDEVSRRLLTEIQRAGERAASLTEQLLAFSRRQVVQPEVLDLNAVVADAEKMLRRLIGEDVELITAPGPGLGPVRADKGQLGQVLLNLAVNARDAMPKGGTLTVATGNIELDEEYAHQNPEVLPGRYAMLAVTDTGVGMDEVTRRRIFEPFFTTKPVGRGTGLGLATVYGIVKQHGGHIEVDTRPGQGTSFRIYLPRVNGEAAGGPDERPRPEAPGGRETVLLVEDEEGVRELARLILQAHGYTVL
ncbi:MAG TPA: PAS domain S-box protein, partial [Gemmataceae bacterium]